MHGTNIKLTKLLFESDGFNDVLSYWPACIVTCISRWTRMYLPGWCFKLSTVEPRFTNAPVHEQILWAKASRITSMQAGNNGKLATEASLEYRRWSASYWLTNLVSVYEHFGSRTASRNELSSWTEVPLNRRMKQMFCSVPRKCCSYLGNYKWRRVERSFRHTKT
jgi:hypothetical protein